jgi:secondary thiamine-phosphate synthase enzyme
MHSQTQTLAKASKAASQIQMTNGAVQIASTIIPLATHSRVELRSITREVAAFVIACPIRNGFVQISPLHTTIGILINETQDALLEDMSALFERLVPSGSYYKHNDSSLSDCERKNADAHLRAILAGISLSIPIVDGKLKLGTWQNILLAEFDGPNQRQVHIQAMGV